MAARRATKTPAKTVAKKADQLSADDIRSIVYNEMKHFLADIEFRVAQAYDVMHRAGELTKVYAEDLALNKHMLTGYTVTANSPGAGQIAWASLHIVYNGTDYAITDGNTALKYAWFAPATSTTALQTNNTKPTLLATDCLVFVNNSGTPTVAVDSTIAPAIANNSVDSNSIIAGAVGNTALASNAVAAGNIQAGAVGTTALASGAVTATILGAGAVTAPKLSIMEHVLY